MPDPDEPLTVGIDGGYVHARGGFSRYLKGALGKVAENAQSESCKMTEEAKLGKVLLLYCDCQPQTDLGRCRLCHHSRNLTKIIVAATTTSCDCRNIRNHEMIIDFGI